MSRATRRAFVTGLAAIGLAAAGRVNVLSVTRAQELIPGGASVSRTTGEPRRAIPSTCFQCPARCGILGFVESGVLVKIEGNPHDPNSRGGLCAKGLAGMNLLYNPDRVLYPMRRDGPRGSGRWKRISWDEALDDVGALLHDVRAGGRHGEFVFEAGLEMQEAAVSRFLRAFGQPTVVDEMALFAANRAAATRSFWGLSSAVPDVANARYILNFGANPFESGSYHIPLAQRIVEGRVQGAKLVTFDPRLSNTATCSDQWLAPRPGTDGMIAAAMANVIMRRELFNDGLLRQRVNISVDELASRLAPYTPERAAEVSGVPAAEIERIAVEYGLARPTSVLTGGGLSHHSNGFASETVVLLLATLTGNLDVPGGLCLPRTYLLGEPDPRPPALGAPPILPQELFARLQQGTLKARLFVSYKANPAYTHPDAQQTVAVLTDETKVERLVVVDDVVTETAALADVVLPAATFLESWDVQSPPAFSMVPFVSLRQPIVPSLGESMAFYDLAVELANRVGGGMEAYFDASADEFLEAAIAGIAGLVKGVGISGLKERGVWYDEQASPQYRSYTRAGFATPSGKLEISREALTEASLRRGHAVQAVQQESLPLVIFQPAVHFRGRTASLKWLSEIAHDSDVWIHPETAKALDLKRGQKLRITSEVAEIFVRPHITQAIRPDVLAMADGSGHWQSGAFARALARRSADPDTALIWWGDKGSGAHVQRLVPVATDPLGGGQGWADVRVTVAPA